MRRILGLMLVVAVLASAAVAWTLRPRLPAAERGRRLAEQVGCFGCHGAGGRGGIANPGRTDETVPNFQDDLMMLAKSPDEIREWIHDGVTRKRSKSETWQAERKNGAVRMPAFGKRLSAGQIDDLVAYVLAVSGNPEPDDALAARGLERAGKLGCVGCHGAGGRLARTNPGSLKGYVPSWDGEDFPELVRDSSEFRQWVARGVSDRFREDRLAQFFLKRAKLRMPSYQRHLEPGDVESLWAYVQWLRSDDSADTTSAEGEH